MATPRFRFVDTGPTIADAEFWRDVEASERLGSRFKASLFLRELCHAKAWAGAELSGADDHFGREQRERALLRAVSARGYRVAADPTGEGAVPLVRTG